MNKNEYRRAFIMLRTLAQGYAGHVRLERRTLGGSMYFVVSAPQGAETLAAALAGQRNGVCYAAPLGALARDRRGQLTLARQFDPRAIAGRPLEAYAWVVVAGDGGRRIVLAGNVEGSRPMDLAALSRAVEDALTPRDIPAADLPERAGGSAGSPESPDGPVPQAAAMAERQTDGEAAFAEQAAGPVDSGADPEPEDIRVYTPARLRAALAQAAPEPSAEQTGSAAQPAPEAPPVRTADAERSAAQAAPVGAADEPQAAPEGQAARVADAACASQEPLAAATQTPPATAAPRDRSAIQPSPEESPAAGAAIPRRESETPVAGTAPETAASDAVEAACPARETAPCEEGADSDANAGLAANAPGETEAVPGQATAAEALGLDITRPWPGALEPLRRLFATQAPAEMPLDDGFTYIRAPLPAASGYGACLIGLKARDGEPLAARYALPGRQAPEPPAGLECYGWVPGGNGEGWWISEHALREQA